jgi:hypothetical protein
MLERFIKIICVKLPIFPPSKILELLIFYFYKLKILIFRGYIYIVTDWMSLIGASLEEQLKKFYLPL